MVMDLFDKMTEVLGEEKVSLREFKELLEAGLSEVKIGIIPPSSDQVLVGDMERTRLKDIRVLFFVGVNDGKIPREDAAGKILSDLNREDLKASSVALAPTYRENLYTQRFYLYLNMTKPSDKLYLSYSRADDGGEPMTQSFFDWCSQEAVSGACFGAAVRGCCLGCGKSQKRTCVSGMGI